MEICNGCVYEKFRRIPETPIKLADAMLIGEAPGSSELSRKAPFVGESGKLLRGALELSGIPVEQCYLTNALLCRPPKGVISRDAIERCRIRVHLEIGRVKPKIIVALGNTAMHSLTGEYSLKITQVHGSPFPWVNLIGNIIVMPCFHPAKILRAPGECASFVAVFEYVAELLKGAPLRNPGETFFHVVPDNEKEVSRVVEFLLKEERLVGIDIETGYSTDPLIGKILAFGLCYKKNCVVVFPDYVFKYSAIKTLLESPKLKLGWQGGQYDTSFFRHIGYPAKIDHDSMYLHYSLNENEGGHDLNTLSRFYLGAEDDRRVAKQYMKPGDGGYQNVPRKVLYPYVAKHCDHTFQLIQQFLPLVESDSDLNILYYKLLLPASRFLRRVQRAGFYVNVGHAEQFGEHLEGEIDKAVDIILDVLQPIWDPNQYMEQTGHKTAPEIFNPGSPEQLKWMLFTKLRLPPKRGKKFSTDKEVLDSLLHRHVCIQPILDYRSIKKVKSTYVDGVLERMNDDHRVRSTFALHRTVTGRLSSRNPNLQNIKDNPDVKTMFGAPPGRILIEADYKGAELRVMAYLSGDRNLREIFLTGKDLHDEVVQMLNTSRIRAKAVNFGIAFGRSAYSLAEEYGMSEREAQWMIDEWFKRFPDVKVYMDQCEQDVIDKKVLTTPFGRKRRFGLLTNQNIKHVKNEARNFRVQSIASDLALTSAMEMQWDLQKLNARIVNMVHDSIIVEAPNNKTTIQAGAALMQNVMVDMPKRDPIKTDVPFLAEIKTGQFWGDLKPLQEGDEY